MSRIKQRNWKNFGLLLTGQSVSQMGSSMTGFALIIWAYSEQNQVMAPSILAVCSTVPCLLVSLFGGTVADKKNKKGLCCFVTVLRPWVRW